jgi:hypothetical protein
MSPEERDFIKAKAAARSLSVAAYLLQRAHEDACGSGDRSVSAFGPSPSATVGGDNSTTAEGPRRFDEVPHAKAGRAVTAAAG